MSCRSSILRPPTLFAHPDTAPVAWLTPLLSCCVQSVVFNPTDAAAVCRAALFGRTTFTITNAITPQTTRNNRNMIHLHTSETGKQVATVGAPRLSLVIRQTHCWPSCELQLQWLCSGCCSVSTPHHTWFEPHTTCPAPGSRLIAYCQL